MPATSAMGNSRLTILMYHALSDGHGACNHADPHYTVSRSAFQRHLNMARSAGWAPSSLADIFESGSYAGKVAFTFDDGHESNLAAASDLVEASSSADFFVNPAQVGKKGYLDWRTLADLAAAGISVQSHGQTHRYLDELSSDALEYELAASKGEIEDRLGRPVFLLAAPGGRLPPQAAPLARRLGYRGICSSRAGIWKAGGSPWEIPRLAVLAATSDRQLGRWLSQEAWEMARLSARYRVLAGAKGLFGNQRYEQLRGLLLGWRGIHS